MTCLQYEQGVADRSINSMTAAVASLSSISLLLTCFLALCSAAAFLLLYLRPLPGSHHRTRQHQPPDGRSRQSHSHKHHRPSSLHLPRSSTRSSISSHANGYSHSPLSPCSPLLLPIPVVLRPSKPSATATSANKKHSTAATNSPSPTLHLHFDPLSVPVIVTISSTPARLPLLLPTLQSLRQQSYPIHRILVCLPAASQSAPPLPDRLSRDPLLVIVRSSAEHGSIGRLVEAGRWLEERGGGGSECWVVSVEDGVVYHRDTIAELVRHGVELDGCVVGTAGYRLLGEPWVMSNVAYVRRWDERLMDEWEEEQDELGLEGEGMHTLGKVEPSNIKSANVRNKPRSASHTSRAPLPRSQQASDSLLPDYHHNGHSTHSSTALHPHSSTLTSHSPSASPQSPLLYPVEPCDVVSSFRAILFPPATLPQPAVLLSHVQSLPATSLRHCDDELLSGVLSLLGISRVCLLTPLPVVQWVVEGKRGRGGGVTEWMAWSECMELMVRRGWWPGWEVDEREAGEAKTDWEGDDDDGMDVRGLIEEGEVSAAGEVVEGAAGAGGGREGQVGGVLGVSVNGGKVKEERKDVTNGGSHSVPRVKAVIGVGGQQ